MALTFIALILRSQAEGGLKSRRAKPHPMHEASCACGQLKVHCEGEPLRVSICHCLDCQKRTGSVFGVQARFARDRVRIEGQAREFARVGDSGGRIRLSFCPECGSTVYLEPDGMPDMIVVPVGAFADPAFPPPTVSVYHDRRHAWVQVPEGAELM